MRSRRWTLDKAGWREDLTNCFLMSSYYVNHIWGKESWSSNHINFQVIDIANVWEGEMLTTWTLETLNKPESIHPRVMNLGSKGNIAYTISLSFNFFRKSEEGEGQTTFLAQHSMIAWILISTIYLKCYFNNWPEF